MVKGLSACVHVGRRRYDLPPATMTDASPPSPRLLIRSRHYYEWGTNLNCLYEHLKNIINGPFLQVRLLYLAVYSFDDTFKYCKQLCINQ